MEKVKDTTKVCGLGYEPGNEATNVSDNDDHELNAKLANTGAKKRKESIP
jgi:hypothetical protein